MKKIVKSLILIAAAAMGFTACQEELQNDAPLTEETVEVKFVASSADTKTSVDTSGDTPLFAWGENETFTVLEQTDALSEATNVVYVKDEEGKANITATFTGYANAGEYKYVTIYPKSGYVGNAGSIGTVTLSLPAVQTMAENSYDPAADLMVSEVVTVPSRPTEAQMVRFTRLAAVAKMTLKNLDLAEGDQVEQVIFTAEGKTLAGTVTADLAKPHEFEVAEGIDNVTVNTTSSGDVYFTLLPCVLGGEEACNYTVTVITKEKLYIKEGTIAAGKSLAFEAGMVTRFGVNMEGIVPSEKWVLVRDASTLEAGDIVTIAASDLNYVLGCNFASNFPYASYTTDVIKSGDYLYHPIVTDKSKYQYMAQSLILAKRDADKVAFDFYNGVDYDGDAKSGYLTNLVTNNYLQLSQYPTNNTLLYVTVDSESGVATISATESEFDTKLLKYRAYNGGTSTSYRRFGFVSTPESEHHDVCIYRLAGAKGVVPTAGAVVTVPEKVSIAKEGVAEEKVFEDVEFTYVGDWTIKATTEADWLTLNYADGVLKYTAQANDAGVRNAVVTITASLEGETPKEWTFNVVQKGAPVKATVEEFIEYAKTVDANVEYEVTGILDTKGSGTSNSTYIVDAEGNKATFKYIDMEDGTDFYKSAIAEGDIVTIVAAVTNKGVGGSSTAHAICKGYYNLSATVEEDLVEYVGGSVVVKLEKSGTLPHGDISCTDDADFAEVEYDPDTYEATVTLKANDGAPRQAVVTFKDDYAKTSVTIVQSADTEKGNTWELVTDASTLAVGDQVIVAAATYDVAMGTTIDSNNRRPGVDVTKLGNYYLTPNADVLTLVLGKGSVDGTFAFYDAVNEGYLVSSSTSSSTYNLKNQTYIDDNTSYAISIADRIATIGNKQGTYSSCKFGYRASTYNYFFSGTSTSQEKVCLYRLVGVKGEIPVTPAVITVPASEVAISEDATTSATSFAGVEFDYVGDWTISVSSSEDWLKVDYADGVLTYTAEANNSTKRSATVTITATLGNQTLEPWKFNVLQKGVAQEISIAQFVTLEADDNQPYKLTGKVVKLAENNSTKGYYLADGAGNQAQINYLKTEAGDAVWGYDDLELKIGDIVTVTTYAQGSKKGGSSSLPSIYKGHYRLSATAGIAADYTGGDVVITVETSSNGTVTAPETIEASSVEYDYAKFSYSGGNSATVTFTSENTTNYAREVEVTFTCGDASVTVVAQQGINPANKLGYELVTDASILAVGDEVIIVAKNADKALGVSTSTITSQTNFPSASIVKSANVIYDAEETGALVFTLADCGTDGKFALQFTHKSSNYYLYIGSTTLKGNTSLSSYTKLSIVIDPENGAATITNSAGTPAIVTYNSTSTKFGSTKVSSDNAADETNDIAIYKKQK